MGYHQVMQYFEDKQGVCRIVQRESKKGEDAEYYIAKERRDGPDKEWYETEVMGERLRSGEVSGNKSPPGEGGPTIHPMNR